VDADNATYLRRCTDRHSAVKSWWTGSQSRLDLPRETIVSRLRPKNRKQRIQQRQINHLPASAIFFNFAQRYHRRSHTIQSATESARYIGGSTGSRSANRSIDANPDMASISVPKPGRCAYGPVWPHPEMRIITRPGLRSKSKLGTQAHLFQRARPKALHENLHEGIKRRSNRAPRVCGDPCKDFSCCARKFSNAWTRHRAPFTQSSPQAAQL